MKSTTLIVAVATGCLLLIGLPGSAQEAVPSGHPPIVPSGHPEITPGQGQPAPVKDIDAKAEDVNSIDAIINAYYGIISGEKGAERDWDRFKTLFAPDARFITLRPSPDGVAPIMITPAQFIATNRQYFKGGGYFEKSVSEEVESYGNVAHVFSTYETRRDKNDADPYSRGINSIQLIGNGERWWIVTIMWDFEREGNPVPEKYLPTK